MVLSRILDSVLFISGELRANRKAMENGREVQPEAKTLFRRPNHQ